MEITTYSTEETKKLAQQLAKNASNGDVFALYGDLGSGKTTFTSYFVEALGVHARVQSPTFVIVRQYEDKQAVIKKVFHLDLYRLTDLESIKDIGIEEMLADKDAIKIIEWPEMVESIIPSSTVKIKFEYVSENERKINVQA